MTHPNTPSPTDPIVITPATREDLPAVVELCMMVEAQHEAYWPLRWKTKPNIREGYLRWMTHRLDDASMLIAVARDPAAKDEPRIPVVRFHDEEPGLFEPGAFPNPTKVAGTIIVSVLDEIPIYTYRQYAYIQDMGVALDYRRRGIATRLLKAAADWTAARGLAQLRLMVADANADARAAFEKVGFRPTYQEMVLPVGEAS